MSKELRKVVPLLERLSLIRMANEEGIKRLAEAVAFADQIQEVNTDGIEPMVSPNDHKCTQMRSDSVVETKKEEILLNAKDTIEGYFVAPNQ